MKNRRSGSGPNLLRARKRLKNSLRKDESFVRYGRDLPDTWGRPELRSGRSGKNATGGAGRFDIRVPIAPGSVIQVGDVIEGILVRLPDSIAPKKVTIELYSDNALVSRSTLPVPENREVITYAVVERHDEQATRFTMTVRAAGYAESVQWILAPAPDRAARRRTV